MKLWRGSGIALIAAMCAIVGGTSTHTVLTAHSGMRNLRMFDDIHELEEGDIVLLHTMGDILAYRVTSSAVVWPDEQNLLLSSQARISRRLSPARPTA